MHLQPSPDSGPAAGDPGSPKVVAVIVTFNRPTMLVQAIESIHKQDREVSAIVVVDNGTSIESREIINRDFPDVVHEQMNDNLGSNGGFNFGIAKALELGADYIWLFNDDAYAEPTALSDTLSAFTESSGQRVAVASTAINNNGVLIYGYRFRGRAIPLKMPVNQSAEDVDMVIFNGALFSADAVRECGLPRPEFFMMWGEWEYCLRFKAAGYRIVCLPQQRITHRTAGSSDAVSGEFPFRSYYQTRNHLVFVMANRSPVNIYWFLNRLIKHIVATILWQDHKMLRLKLRFRGIFDALRGNMGRTLEPSGSFNPRQR